MSYQTRFLLPRLGDSDEGGRIVNWLKQPGDSFEKNDVLLELETDKAVVEVPAPAAGILLEQIAAIDDVVELEGPLAQVEFEGEAPEQLESTALATAADEVEVTPDRSSPEPAPAVRARCSGGRVFASPYARKLAHERGIDLTRLTGSGKRGRIVAADIPRSVMRGGTRDADQAFSTNVEIREHRAPAGTGEVFVKYWTPAVRHTQSTLILIHGFFGNVDVWTASAAMLARRGVPVIALDLPCHGRTTANAVEFETAVETVAEAIYALATDSVVLVGHSFGGAIAARAARSSNIDVIALGLIAPVGLGTEIDRSFLDGMALARSIDAVRREMRKLTVRSVPVGKEYQDLLRQYIEAQSSNLFALCESAAADGVQQIDIVPDLESVGVPVTIIHGRSDSIIPWQHALNAPPTSALHLIPDTGHMPQWESSALTTDIIATLCGD